MKAATAKTGQPLIERDVIAAMWKPKPRYWAALAATMFCALLGLSAWTYQIFRGMGVAAKNNPVGWVFYITNFVFWVGIAHSGTLISAVLFLFRAKFRNRFNRSAEAMTIFAVMTAGMFPLIHLGRVWRFYWLLPYPNQRQLWVNFRSPLVWDVFAVTAYFTVSLIFFYVGMIPDLAVVWRHATGFKRLAYRIASLGWIGSLRQWKHYNQLYTLLAAFATPLVISVHSVVSWDFAMSIVPGWHTTIFAPYFVAGAIFSGTAMVITLVIPMRKLLSLEDYILPRHFDLLSRVLLFMSLIVTFSYLTEYAMALYSNNIFELGATTYRFFGDYRYLYWLMLFCNSILPLTLFVRKLRLKPRYLMVVAIFVNIGMWLERFVIIVASLSHSYEPYVWRTIRPTIVELLITLGSFGMFFSLFLLFTKFLPVLSITEIKEESMEAHA